MFRAVRAWRIYIIAYYNRCPDVRNSPAITSARSVIYSEFFQVLPLTDSTDLSRLQFVPAPPLNSTGTKVLPPPMRAARLASTSDERVRQSMSYI
jgi:hypothetical protein